MHILFKCKILCCSKRHTRRGNTLNSRVICQVDEQYRPVDGSCLLKGLDKVVRLLEGNTHGSKYNGEVLICSAYLSLSCNLRCKL